MRKAGILRAAAAAILGAALFTGASVSGLQAKTLKLGHSLAGGDHPYHLGALKFKEILEAKSDGKIKVEIFPNSQLGGERDMVEGLKIGTVDLVIAAATLGGSIANDRKVYLVAMPFIFKDYDAVDRVLEGDIGNEMSQNWPSAGFRNVGYFIAGFHNLANSKKPIRTPADFKGMKMRAIQSKAMTLQINTLGPNAVPMAFPEVYTGIQQGVVDGFANSLTTFYLKKYYEVAPYISVSRHGVGILSLMMSEKSYQGFSDAERKMIDEAGVEAARYQRGLYREGDKKYLEELKKVANVNTDVDREAFKKYTAGFTEQFVELVGEPGAEDFAKRMLAEGAK
ncbi:MAG: TRAP transporter substrate-binding protein [Pseudomonadota bacterium]